MPFRGLFGRVNALKPLAAMLTIAPRKLSKTVLPRDSRVGAGAGRVALLQGCVEPVLKPEYRAAAVRLLNRTGRSEEHTSELQSLMRISYAVFCLKKKKKK